jgi:hypothetical protein
MVFTLDSGNSQSAAVLPLKFLAALICRSGEIFFL